MVRKPIKTPTVPVRLGTLESLARTLHAVSARRTAYDALPKRDKEQLWRQAEAARRHILRLNSPTEMRPAGDPSSVTAQVDRMARIAAGRPDDTGPTPGLLAKRCTPRADVLEKLAANGRLNDVHLQAADEIRRLWIALDRNLSTNTAGLTSPRVDRSRRLSDPLDRFKDVELIAYENRYRLWAKEASAAPVRPKRNRAGRPASTETQAAIPGTDALSLVLSVVCENQPPTRLERDHGLPVGRCVTGLLANWLYRYADIAGWLNDRNTEKKN
ncbi:MAG: hypothetical protein RIM72_00570 [Alphaproteobacteria bacterium]